MSAMPGAPSIQNTIPTPFFGATPFAAPGLGVLASLIKLGIGLWWLALLRPRASPATSNCENAQRRPANSTPPRSRSV